MALPKLMRDIFANEGAGPLFRKDKIPAIGEADVPSVFVKVAVQTFSDAQKKQARANIGADAIPPGTMMAYGGKSIPDGWLLCNGALVSRTTYAGLFRAIGTAWGAGDGSTTFKLPDVDGRVMQGVTDTSKVGLYLKAGLPNIIGTFGAGYAKYVGCTGIFQLDERKTAGGVTQYSDSSAWKISANVQRQNPLFNDTNTVQPNAIQTLIIIKA